jgi:hypothetical protein
MTLAYISATFSWAFATVFITTELHYAQGPMSYLVLLINILVPLRLLRLVLHG